MNKFLINGGKKITGEVRIAGSKNAALPLIAATLLTEQKCRLENVPDILDVHSLASIIEDLGGKVSYESRGLTIHNRKLSKSAPSPKKVGASRASVLLMGALLARNGRAEIAYPGGDKIGARPIDIHLRVMKKLGASVNEGKRILLKVKKLKGARVFTESSVLATENALLAASLASGTTVIKGAAMEPHVVQLQKYLQKMGAHIRGVGTSEVTVKGVLKLRGAKIRVIPDMIETGSFAILAAMTRGELILKGVDHTHMDAFYQKLDEIGVSFDKNPHELIIKDPQPRLRSVAIRTGIYPNLATDLQPPFGVLATKAVGNTTIHDWIFEGRLGYLAELKKMGARYKKIDNHAAEIYGPVSLKGANISCADIRSGITLLIAALSAKGTSVLSEIRHLDRGYEHLETRLQNIGADIVRIE